MAGIAGCSGIVGGEASGEVVENVFDEIEVQSHRLENGIVLGSEVVTTIVTVENVGQEEIEIALNTTLYDGNDTIVGSDELSADETIGGETTKEVSESYEGRKDDVARYEIRITAEETETAEEELSVVLPPNSAELLQRGVLSEHDFAESSFTEEQVGTAVNELNLQNADTSSVTDMREMFFSAESFDQDISGWCVEQINSKPDSFGQGAGFEGDDTKQPHWGEPC
jgi:Mycoplasma protein of unknown function, DUF285.